LRAAFSCVISSWAAPSAKASGASPSPISTTSCGPLAVGTAPSRVWPASDWRSSSWSASKNLRAQPGSHRRALRSAWPEGLVREEPYAVPSSHRLVPLGPLDAPQWPSFGGSRPYRCPRAGWGRLRRHYLPRRKRSSNTPRAGSPSRLQVPPSSRNNPACVAESTQRSLKTD
jgi:hypothetical protein